MILETVGTRRAELHYDPAGRWRRTVTDTPSSLTTVREPNLGVAVGRSVWGISAELSG